MGKGDGVCTRCKGKGDDVCIRCKCKGDDVCYRCKGKVMVFLLAVTSCNPTGQHDKTKLFIKRHDFEPTFFTTCQILKRLFYNMSDCQTTFLQQVRFWIKKKIFKLEITTVCCI